MPLDAHSLLLYAVTDRAWVGRQTLLEQIEAALQGGATLVQLREKELETEAFVNEARQVLRLCRRYGVPLIINDRVDVALQSGADGVHVGQQDQPVHAVRQMAGGRLIIGATAKTVGQARLAQAQGADYLGVGALFPSPTKKDAVRITPQELRQICASVHIPAVAIGGIGPGNIGQLQGCGVQGVAVVSSLFGAKDIRLAAAQLKEGARLLVGSAGDTSPERRNP